MFATLVIVLPLVPASADSELIVRHKGREVRLDLRLEEPSEVRFAAFYADCVHQDVPLIQGHRLALIYNLMRPSRRTMTAKPSVPQPFSRTGRRSLVDWRTTGLTN